MRDSFAVPLFAALVFPIPASAGDIPLVAIGLPFEPEAPQPVAIDHPLFELIEIPEIENLPSAVGGSALAFIKAAKRSSINKGLHETFRQMHMLSPNPAQSRGTLVVTWIGTHTPFKVGGRNEATVTMRYRLIRKDNNKVLFDREITTSAGGGGVDATVRDMGIVRAAIATNFASAAYCLDHSSLGHWPDDCALTPKFSVTVMRR